MTFEHNYFRRLADVVFDLAGPRAAGRVIDLRGNSAVIEGLTVPVGGRVTIDRFRRRGARAEVVGVEGARSRIALLEHPGSVLPGASAEFHSPVAVIGASRNLLGRAVDPLGRPADGLGPISGRVPVTLVEPGAFARPLARTRLTRGVARLAPGIHIFRGARVAVAEASSATLAGLALAHDGPVVAALVGGTPGSHVAFRWALGEAGARTVCVLEPGRPGPVRARTAYRVAETLARFLAKEEERDAVLVVDWRVAGPAPVADVAPVEEVTAFWSGVEFSVSFDAEIAARPERIAC
jgi:flagellar biosynthesis/type III secretory pathway ATPase